LVLDVASYYRPVRSFLGGFATGGNDRLRGYKPNQFVGEGIANANAEFRSSPLELLSVNTGLAIFFDAGGAFNRVAPNEMQSEIQGQRRRPSFAVEGGYGAGVGLRFLAPQLDRDPFRIDVAVPLGSGSLADVRVYASFYQAFGPPFAAPRVLLPQ
jgi:outer membrane protein assembly factor BamA